MRVFTLIPMRYWREAGPAAHAAEDAGFDAVMTVELAHDVFTPLAMAALATSRLELTPSIAVAFPRTRQSWRIRPGTCTPIRTGASCSALVAR
jgi:hypothetical protein